MEHIGPCPAGSGNEDERQESEKKDELTPQSPTLLGTHILHNFKHNVVDQPSFFAQFQNASVLDDVIADDQVEALLNEATDIASMILNCGDDDTLTISHNPSLFDPNFRPSFKDLNTYETFQKQTGLSIKINSEDITNEQFSKLHSNDSFMNPINNLSLLLNPNTANQSNSNNSGPSPFSMKLTPPSPDM